MGKEIEIWGDGSNVRDYIYIEDVADAIILSQNIPTKNNIYNIGSGKGTSLNEILKIISSIVKDKYSIKYLPNRSFDIKNNYLNIERAIKDLNWEPKIDMFSGINKVWESFKRRF